MLDADSVKEALEALCLKFEKDKAHYLSKGYPESQVRIDFLDPLFNILGWDIANTAQKPPHERDVIVEASSEATGRPDYNFRIKGITKFFVEAKSPLTNLNDARHILQAKSYAWSTKGVFFVILTNYAEFKLFDASLKPNPRFPKEGLIYDLEYTDYLSNIGKLLELSKERVDEGSLEALIPKDLKSKRLRIPPDKSFLEDLTVWRTELAKDIHKRNPGFDVKLLNDVVQKLLDRIIFIRIAEDRNIRQNRELWEIVAQWKGEGRRKPIMANLKNLFYRINDDLNGNIFKPHACEEADIDSGLLAEIIENLYAPKSQYRFEAIGVELLGSIYERYLGSTIRVTPQRVKVEEKPEVRKAGGVYYTPKYIVDYVVKNTVGRVIEGKTPKQIEKIRILDPACGSGSFLLGAYQYLIDYHLKYYREHPKQARVLYYDPYYKIKPDEITLPIQEKARILKNNLFGVDKDPQAVEITMMSLYLKAIEGERGFLPMRQHFLPPLTYNIVCGNSLVGYDMFEGQLFDDGTKDEINPFDWPSKAAGFGEIMESGGFDVVIGNPPYVRIQTLNRQEVEYFNGKYKSASGNYDIYILFVEKAMQLLKENGVHGFILPHKFFQASYGQGLRKLISENSSVMEIVHFKDNQVFEGASTYTCLLFLSKSKTGKFKYAEISKFISPAEQLDAVGVNKKYSDENMRVGFIEKKQVTPYLWSFHFDESVSVMDKLKIGTQPLEAFTERIFQGLKTSVRTRFIYWMSRNIGAKQYLSALRNWKEMWRSNRNCSSR
ncbi:MAG: Eco57I restriction-modification methylase domain-containing protein [Proteobacteria bacterium]|nr:Eco57I restriction-modification methylase domain-containing protein [Pseudomonadota bacterium]